MAEERAVEMVIIDGFIFDCAHGGEEALAKANVKALTHGGAS